MSDDKVHHFGYHSIQHVTEATENYLTWGVNGWAKRMPGSIWQTPDGGEVEVTCVGRSRDPKEGGYFWPDAVSVGPVVRYLRDAEASVSTPAHEAS